MALLAQAPRDGSDAIMVLDSPDALANRALIAELIGGARIPALYPFSEFVDAGGLMAYSFDLTELIKRVANSRNDALWCSRRISVSTIGARYFLFTLP